ncbi:hypothetical protein NMY22_g16388 [Coprinellus aureogranulatus]|nr:hypothetical protein NMY22_g16388 [Coprinellus aureogranulatus]
MLEVPLRPDPGFQWHNLRSLIPPVSTGPTVVANDYDSLHVPPPYRYRRKHHLLPSAIRHPLSAPPSAPSLIPSVLVSPPYSSLPPHLSSVYGVREGHGSIHARAIRLMESKCAVFRAGLALGLESILFYTSWPQIHLLPSQLGQPRWDHVDLNKFKTRSHPELNYAIMNLGSRGKLPSPQPENASSPPQESLPEASIATVIISTPIGVYNPQGGPLGQRRFANVAPTATQLGPSLAREPEIEPCPSRTPYPCLLPSAAHAHVPSDSIDHARSLMASNLNPYRALSTRRLGSPADPEISNDPGWNAVDLQPLPPLQRSADQILSSQVPDLIRTEFSAPPSRGTFEDANTVIANVARASQRRLDLDPSSFTSQITTGGQPPHSGTRGAHQADARGR